MSIIQNGTKASVFRNRTEDKNTLTQKGALYAGTGSTNTVDSETVYTTTSITPPPTLMMF